MSLHFAFYDTKKSLSFNGRWKKGKKQPLGFFWFFVRLPIYTWIISFKQGIPNL